MSVPKEATHRVVLGLIAGLSAWTTALGNGGPFVVKYPGGDPAAKGVLARLDPSLLPARETRLRVIKEDLTIAFQPDRFRRGSSTMPLAMVSAEYTIENPTLDDVAVDFGFPILRGIYMNPMSMLPKPEVDVTVRLAEMAMEADPAATVLGPGMRPDRGSSVRATIISNSAIYGVIRARAREVIQSGVAADEQLAEFVARVQAAGPMRVGPAPMQQARRVAYEKQPVARRQDGVSARAALKRYLTSELGWNDRDAALMVEYASLDLGKPGPLPLDQWNRTGMFFTQDAELVRVAGENLGALAAIGEQKATQFLAQLASRFDWNEKAAYEAIFGAWGGDVRERSIDLATGRIRPREIDIEEAAARGTLASGLPAADPTVFARVDYLDPNAKVSKAERQACRRVLKNLPVVFTFAPMNLVHYQVNFPAESKQVVTVAYRQYAYTDTRNPASYQLAYVLHPASLWQSFGPIHLTVWAPKGTHCRASVPLARTDKALDHQHIFAGLPALQPYESTLVGKSQKKGELFVAVEKSAWDQQFEVRTNETAAAGR